MPEYRTILTVPDLPLEDSARWEPLIHWLELNYQGMGPIIGWEGDAAQLFLATDADDPAQAVRATTAVVADGLHANGLGDRWPASCEVEVV